MQNEVINRKLESLRHCLARIQSKMPLTYEMLSTDYDLQDIIAVNLERVVQICVDIAAHVLSETEAPPPSTMAEGFERLAELDVIEPPLAGRLRQAVALRNILVHNYTDINWKIILAIITHDITDFVQFARAIDQLTNG